MLGSLLITTGLAAAFAACLTLYMLPALIGWLRHVPDIGSVAVINVLLGWTLVGWVLALAMALRTVTPGGPLVQVVQNVPACGPSHLVSRQVAGATHQALLRFRTANCRRWTCRPVPRGR